MVTMVLMLVSFFTPAASLQGPGHCNHCGGSSQIAATTPTLKPGHCGYCRPSW